MTMNYTEAKAYLSKQGVTLRKNQYNEYTVQHKHSIDDATKYYTDDLQDAIGTAINYYTKG